MILVTQPREELVTELRGILDRLGFSCQVSMGEEQAVLSLSGDGKLEELEAALGEFPDVDVIPILSGREYWKRRSRRGFMAGVSAGLGVLTAAGLGIPVVGFLLPPTGVLRTPQVVRAARVGELPENSATTVRFQGSPVLLIHREGGGYFALSAVCTHMDVCQLDWDPGRRQLVCPCHGGAFDVHGNVVQGPPSIPLPTFEVEQSEEDILIKRGDDPMLRQEHGLLNALGQLLRSPVPPTYRGALSFGWWILFLFLVQILTGILLSFYYQPSPEMAPESVRFIMRDVHWGWLVRGVHHWASYGMILLGILQFVRVFVLGSYRGPGTTHWFLGFLLMAMVLLFAWSGNVLRWDQDAYWSVSRVLDNVAKVPGIGTSLALALRGGENITASTLSRVYSVHVMLLPWLNFFLVLANLWLLARGRNHRREESR